MNSRRQWPHHHVCSCRVCTTGNHR